MIRFLKLHLLHSLPKYSLSLSPPSPYLPLASAGQSGNVIYIGSFSKMLDPSLRVGFMVAQKNFIAQCTALRSKKAKKIYHHRRDFLNVLLKEKSHPYIPYTLPTGGMAIYIKLLPAYPASGLKELHLLRIVKVYEEQNSFRFGFASMNEEELKEAVDILENTLGRNKFS